MNIHASCWDQECAAFDWLASWILVVGVDDHIVYVNAACEDALGCSRKLLLGSLVTQWFANGGAIFQTLTRARQKHFSAIRFDSVVLHASKESIPVHVLVTAADSLGVVVIELLPLEVQERQNKEDRQVDLAMANKTLIRNLAHEIKNPLGGIRGSAQLLELELNSKELMEYTQVIMRETDRLQALVDRLLMPHRQGYELSDVNIHEVCEHVRTLLMAEFGKEISIRRDYDTSIPEFKGVKEQLIQAVLNLAHNAALALQDLRKEERPEVIFRTRIARQVTFAKKRFKLALELHVVDNGPGIPEEIKDRLFHPLVSGREGGSGLGLHLAQLLVQQHQGLIQCSSRPGRTEFTILIPLG